jgi:CpeT/CpcT family (DUF1001)
MISDSISFASVPCFHAPSVPVHHSAILASTPPASVRAPTRRRARPDAGTKRCRAAHVKAYCCARNAASAGLESSSGPPVSDVDCSDSTRQHAGSETDSEAFADDIIDNSAWARGLLTDSVLEVKWKAEQQKGLQGDLCSCATGEARTNHIVPIADPARFSDFTRVAAPTARLGHPSSTPSHSPFASVPDPDSGAATGRGLEETHLHMAALECTSDNNGSGDQDVHVDGDGIVNCARDRPRPIVDTTSFEKIMPYSPISLAQRMVRYARAKKHCAEFLAFFQGEFDNYEQIAEQRAKGIFPVDGGGHEHIHCSLTVLNEDMLFARYYFNGDPSVVFRSRLYRIYVSDTSESDVIEMRIFRFYEETERKLKASNYDISAVEWDDGDVYDWLQGCEVFWERYEPPMGTEDAGCRQLGIADGPRFVGYMKGGGCELYSREIDGRIRVMDDLLLTSRDLWVADRGFDESGQFVYGNRRGIPYQMKRVDLNGPAAWTLSTGPAPDGYVS